MSCILKITITGWIIMLFLLLLLMLLLFVINREATARSCFQSCGGKSKDEEESTSFTQLRKSQGADTLINFTVLTYCILENKSKTEWQDCLLVKYQPTSIDSNNLQQARIWHRHTQQQLNAQHCSDGNNDEEWFCFKGNDLDLTFSSYTFQFFTCNFF